jgi:hypothetical protein
MRQDVGLGSFDFATPANVETLLSIIRRPILIRQTRQTVNAPLSRSPASVHTQMIFATDSKRIQPFPSKLLATHSALPEKTTADSHAPI